MASARADVFEKNDLQYERLNNKDWLFNPCFAAICCSLATVNFGYALGFSAEAELTGIFSMTDIFNMTCSSQEIPKPGSHGFDIFASLVALGALVGALLGGYLMDKVGRKPTVLATALFYAPGWLLITASFCYHHPYPTDPPVQFPTNYKGLVPWVCPGYKMKALKLCIGRLLTGIGVGMSSLVVPVYIAEVSPARVRGALGNINQVSINFGFVLSYTLGYRYGLPTSTLFPIGVSLVNVLLMVLFLPETPRYLLANKRRHEAILALHWLRGPDYQVEEECFEIEATVNFGDQDRWQWKDLKSSTFYWPLCISILLMFFQEFSGINCILFYCPSLFHSVGIGANLNPEMKDHAEILQSIADNSMQTAIYVCVTLLVFTIISCFLVDRLGRRKLLLSGSLVMFLMLVLVGAYVKYFPTNNNAFVHYIQKHSVYTWLAFAGTLTFIAMFSLGWGPIPWLLMSELFPMKTRAVATGTVTCFNWLFVFITTVSFSDIIKISGISGILWIFAGITLVGFFFTLFFVPETRGRPLEDVAEMFLRRQILQVNIPWTRHDVLYSTEDLS